MVSITHCESDDKTEAETETKALPCEEKPTSCNGKIDEATSEVKSTTTEILEKPKMVITSKAEIELDDDDDEDEEYDESIVERLLGLSEMFPQSLRNATCTVVCGAFSFIKGTYSLSRQVVWVGVSSSVILFAPVMFELERYNVEEMVKQDRNRLVLGPGSAVSGTPGLAPPPMR